MSAVITAADIVFDPVAHVYTMPSGDAVPSVTRILSAVGVSTDFEELRSFSKRRAAVIELKRDIGSALHQDAHAYDDNDLDWSTVDPRVSPYLEAWATFRENLRLIPVTRERLVYHDLLQYAGTFDGIFLMPNGRRVLIDVKTGDPASSGCQWQTAAYAEAYRREHPAEIIDARWGVQLTPDKAVPYRLFPYEDWTDFVTFQAFLTTYRHQAARRG